MDNKTPKATIDALSPTWADALTDPGAFTREQSQLGHFWTFLGLTSDAPHDGDWFRATLGGRSIFVQRFGEELRGFENKCVHRFFPLRTADKGNGVIRCGFHHWQYNKEGRAVGIPMCQELFGKTPRELDAHLNIVEVATCGMLIFGRFPAPHATETLEDYLGDSFEILQAFCKGAKAPRHFSRLIKANWKLCLHVALDDYHIVAVHGDTFGKFGYLEQRVTRYFDFGMHSAFFNACKDADALTTMLAAVRDGTYQPPTYRTFNIFPNFAAAHSDTLDRWYITLHQYLPLSVDRTIWKIWYFPSPFPLPKKSWFRTLVSNYIALWLPLAVRYYAGKVASEDQQVCERLQTIASQAGGSPIIGLQEKRIAWFERAYDIAMGAVPARKRLKGGRA
jgi:phenylpropionate dioxygenase-like ring-hydroxylating dioxygenase large terminal subunit